MGDPRDIDTASAFELNTDERDLIRSLILADPDLVLEDDVVMRALIGARNGGPRKVVDLRDRLVERMESRLRLLVRTNRSVIAAAYETVAGTAQLHRAVTALVGERELAPFLVSLTTEAPALVGVEEARLCIEADVDDARPITEFGIDLGGRVLAVPFGTVDAYLSAEGEELDQGVILREASDAAEVVFGYPNRVRAEALMRLDIGGTPGLLAFGASDPDRFGPDQGTDLLVFFAGVVGELLHQRLEAAGHAG